MNVEVGCIARWRDQLWIIERIDQFGYAWCARGDRLRSGFQLVAVHTDHLALVANPSLAVYHVESTSNWVA